MQLRRMEEKIVNGKSITVETKTAERGEDFSLALQIPISDEATVAELVRRRDIIAKQCEQYGDIGEDTKNFHITICLFYPRVNKVQLKAVKEVLQYMLDKYGEQTFALTLTEENAIFGHQSGNQFPVAIVEKSSQLTNFHNDLVSQLFNKGITILRHTEGFNPHISLSFGGMAIESEVLAACEGKAMDFSVAGSTFEFSHKNRTNEYIAITPADLKVMKSTWVTSFAQSNLTLLGNPNQASDLEDKEGLLSGQQKDETKPSCCRCNLF